MFSVETWNIYAMTGYEPMYTFYEDFSIAERFGLPAIKDTYKTAFKGWKNNYKALTEFVMALNWKMWRWAESNPALSRFYQTLWEEADAFACDNLKGEELSYFYNTTD